MGIVYLTTEQKGQKGLNRQAGDEIQITQQMIDAGVYAAREHCLGEELQSLVFAVFMAMRIEELNSKGLRGLDEIA